MRREVQGVVLALLGATVLRLALSDMMLSYVKPGMKPFLVASGVVLLVLGVLSALLDSRPSSDGGKAHSAPRAAWLLVVPVLLVFLVAPPALGAFSAERVPTAVPLKGEFDVDSLPADDPVELPLYDYAYRATWDEGETLQGRSVLLTGFATIDVDGSWYVNRLQLSCCAADARVSRVEVVDSPPPAPDAWVQVTGEWQPSEGTTNASDAAIAVISASSVLEIQRPKNAYE